MFEQFCVEFEHRSIDYALRDWKVIETLKCQNLQLIDIHNKPSWQQRVILSDIQISQLCAFSCKIHLKINIKYVSLCHVMFRPKTKQMTDQHQCTILCIYYNLFWFGFSVLIRLMHLQHFVLLMHMDNVIRCVSFLKHNMVLNLLQSANNLVSLKQRGKTKE